MNTDHRIELGLLSIIEGWTLVLTIYLAFSKASKRAGRQAGWRVGKPVGKRAGWLSGQPASKQAGGRAGEAADVSAV